MDEFNDEPKHLRNQLLTCAVIIGLILTGMYILYPEDAAGNRIEFNLYNNNKNLITGSYFVVLDSTENENRDWQFQAAVTYIPAVMGEKMLAGEEYRPLVFSTSPAKPRPIAKYSDLTTIKISEFGEDTNEASIEIAKQYWASAKTIILVSNYNYALLATPLATLLDLPIIFDGKKTDDFISDMGVKSAITIGKVRNYNNIGIKHLSSTGDIWEMYVDSLKKNGEKCEYIVVTNPYDINLDDPDLYIPGLSLASGVLAAGRNALLVTGDYTAKLEWIQQLGYGLDDAGSGERGNDEDNLTDEQELELQLNVNNKAVQIDKDISEAVEFLKTYEFSPKYVALVGGPVAVPMMYVKSPVWLDSDQEEKGEEYIATDTYFGDLDVNLDSEEDQNKNYYYDYDELYEPELAVGRIVAQDLGDASALVTRSLGYWDYEFEPAGILEINHWSKRALIVTSLMTGDSDNMAAKHQQEMFLENLMIAEEYNPDRIGATTDINGLDVKDQMERVNGIIYDGHGYPDGWYHMWMSTGSDESDWDRIGAEDINQLNLHAIPVFGACCLSSALDWPAVGSGGSNEKSMTPENCMSLAFIHAGAICYLGATEESWGSFFGGLLDDDPDAWGYGDFDLPTMFWDHLLHHNLEIGWALNDAKEQFLEEIWTDPAGKPFARLCMLETVLYGDPAAQNGHPDFDM